MLKTESKGRGKLMQKALAEISALGEPHDGTQTFILTKSGRYIARTLPLFSSFSQSAFIFRDEAQAREFIRKFPVILAGARVGHFNPRRRRA